MAVTRSLEESESLCVWCGKQGGDLTLGGRKKTRAEERERDKPIAKMHFALCWTVNVRAVHSNEVSQSAKHSHQWLIKLFNLCSFCKHIFLDFFCFRDAKLYNIYI